MRLKVFRTETANSHLGMKGFGFLGEISSLRRALGNSRVAAQSAGKRGAAREV